MKNKLINKQNIIPMLWIFVTYSCASSFMQIHQTVSDVEGLKEKSIINFNTINPGEKCYFYICATNLFMSLNRQSIIPNSSRLEESVMGQKIAYSHRETLE